MKQDLIKDVILGMLPYLNNAQNEKLQEVLRYTLAKYEVTGNQNKEKYSEQNYIELFISAKRIEGCSEKSLKYYKATIEAMLDELQKDVKHIVTDDIRGYLTEYQEKKKSSKVTDIQIKMFDDHIVVESPGKLPGLVRADNIRFTHFSRNPKIAEFLKNYKFVKEFGEGVNRMCNELEQVGLKDPVYHTNAFMLQAVIYNSKVGKNIVEKTADSLKKLAVAVNKSLIDYQKPAIGEEKSAIDDKKSAVDRIKSAIEQQKYNEPSKANILKVYDEIEKNQIFGTKEIKEILDCSPSTARAVMTKLRDMKVVKVVNGKGKGKYVFIE